MSPSFGQTLKEGEIMQKGKTFLVMWRDFPLFITREDQLTDKLTIGANNPVAAVLARTNLTVFRPCISYIQRPLQLVQTFQTFGR